MKRKIVLFFVSVLLPGLCFAAESANYKTNTFSIDGGGGKSAGTSYKTIANFGVGGFGDGTSASYKGQEGYIYTVNTDAVFDSTAPVITALTSSTHVSQSSCYSNNTPAYSWTGSDGSGSGVANFYYALDQTLDVSSAYLSTNGVQVSSSTTSYTSGLKADGTWYFHLTAKDNAGNVSSVGTYTTCIDTVKPTISVVSSGSVTNSSAVISWSTNEASDSLVEYGTTTSYGSATTLDTNLVTSHSIAISSGLSASTPYHYRVKSKDGAGNEEVSADSTFTTTATPDTTPPVISSVTAANITTTSATITWQTDEASDSKVDYGTTASYGTTVSNANNVTSHSVDLTGLTGSTTYHYKVTSKDASNNSASSSDLQFTTATPDVTAPVVTTTSISSGAPTVNSATITFTTDESSVCKIDYGTTTAYGNSTNYETTAATNHSIALTGLSGNTEYHYAITCKDGASPPNISSATTDKTFTTATPADTTAPVISGVTATQITTNGAVVSWTTDEDSDSEVEYGTTTSYGSATGVNETDTKNHSLSLTGLSSDTLYHYRVKSKDAYNNLATSSDGTFTTAAAVDTTAPDVPSSSISTGTPAYNSVTLTFSTDENAVCKMDYGLTTSYGSSTAYETTYTKSHSVTLTGLSANTTYNYRIICKDTNGNEIAATSAPNQTVITAPPPESVPPVISSLSASSVSNTSVVINWTTDEGADSLVEYGTSTSYGSSTTLNTSLVTTHAIGLSGLSASTLYHYRVSSKDQYGNSATSSDNTFTTASTGDTTAPVISSSSISAGTPGDLTASITWTTDEVSTSQVEYGTTTSYGSTTTLDTLLVTSHTVNLSSLTPGTLYHFRVKSKDAAGNEAVSEDNTFTTAAAVDTTAPVISSPAANNITTTSARISWTTDEASDSQVEYGTSTSYGSATTLDATLATGHSVNLSGLTKNTLYHYRVKSKDKYSNAAASGDFTFTTASDNDTTKPVITNVSAGSLTISSATITWTTDEPATSQVEYGQTTSYGSNTTLDANLVTSHSVSLSGLSQGTTYYYKVKSKDAAGNEQVASTDTSGNALSFPTSAPSQQEEDKTTPSCAVSKITSTDKTEATQIKVTWTGQDNKTAESSLTFDVQVKDVLDGNWLDFSTGQKGTREAFYPPSPNPLSLKFDNGHKYLFRCRAKDEATNQGCYPDDETCKPRITDTEDKLKAAIAVARSEEGKSDETVEKQLWGIVSFPYEPDADKASVSAALSALIPDINKDYTQGASQLLIWDPDLVDNSECSTCNRYQHATKIVVGKGYFLWPSTSVGSVAVKITGKPKNQGTTQDVTLSVNAKDASGSWNMFGSPYLFNVDWKDIMVRVEGDADKTLQQAIDAGLIKSTVYTYGKKLDGTLGYTSQTAPDGVLKPWKGYFVKAMKTLTLLFQPKQSAQKVKETEDEGVFAKTLASANNGFVMEMSARASFFSDSDNYFGVVADASDDEDKYDIEDPPRVSPSVSLSFHGRNIKYAYDVKAKGSGTATGKTWTFAVETDVKDSNVEVKWKPVTGAAAEKMALLDVTANMLVDMTQGASYQYPSGSGGRRLFKIFYGKELVEKEQEKRTGPVNLLEAYTAPNPYRGAGSSTVDAKGKLLSPAQGVTFRYKLSGQVMRVHIEVYTITGKIVDKFEGELDGDTVWPFGNQLSNGVYIYRITAYDAQGNQAKKVNKLVVIK